MAPFVIGLCFLLLMISGQPDRALRGHNDFVQLYVGSQLVGTPDLYSREANLKQVQEAIGFTMESVVFTRPPFYAVLLRPLSWFSYPVAYGLFSLASFGSILWFVISYRREFPALPLLAAMGVPLGLALCTGQDTPFLLLILGVAILLLRRGLDFAAGLLLSLLAIKFHLFLFLPLALLLKKRWSTLSGGITGLVAATLLGLLVAGPDSLSRYVQVLRDPWINPVATHMPNLHGLAANLGGGWWLEAALISVLAIGFVWTALRVQDFELVFAMSLVCGLLVSFHSGLADDVVLYAALVILIHATQNVPVRAMATLILTPIPSVMVMVGPPYSMALPLLLLGLVGMVAWKSCGRDSFGARVDAKL